jgi:hypothetical protein
MELANAIEAPLLGAHPNAPDVGLVKYYTLASDLREYARFDSGDIQFRNPRYWLWKGGFQGTSIAQWLRNTASQPQSRRTNFLVPFATARLTNLTFSSRDDLSVGSRIRVRFIEEPIDSAGDIAAGDSITLDLFSDDLDVTNYREGKRFLVDLRSRNIVVDNTKRYAIQIDNIGNTTPYRDIRVEVGIEERLVQP